MGAARSQQAAAAGTLQLRRLQRGFPPQCAEQNHDHLICKIPPKHRLTGRSQTQKALPLFGKAFLCKNFKHITEFTVLPCSEKEPNPSFILK